MKPKYVKALLLLALTFLISCSGTTTEKDQKHSIVRIVKKIPITSPIGLDVDAVGSGCLVKIENEVYLISAYHVRGNNKVIFLKYPAEMNSQIYTATFHKSDKLNDLVAYKLDHTPNKFLKFADTPPLDNSNVRLLGYVAHHRIRSIDPPLSDFTAKVSTKTDTDSLGTERFLYTIETKGGMSGGACLNEKGELVSIIQGSIIGGAPTGRGSTFKDLQKFLYSL